MKAAPILVSFRRAAWVLLVLNLLDIIITLFALNVGAKEGNPLAKFLIETRLIYPAKVLLPGFIIFTAYWVKARGKIDELAVRRIWFIVGIYSLVVVLNLMTWARYAR